ncbi:unnamed protein product [Parajaminaea phylloscopi]
MSLVRTMAPNGERVQGKPYSVRGRGRGPLVTHDRRVLDYDHVAGRCGARAEPGRGNEFRWRPHRRSNGQRGRERELPSQTFSLDSDRLKTTTTMSAAFRTLSLGLGPFKHKHEVHAQVFSRNDSPQSDAHENATGTSSTPSHKAALPAELDFFGASASRKDDADASETKSVEQTSQKKRKRQSSIKEAAEDQPNTPSSAAALDSAEAIKAYLRKHRLNMTGSDVPAPLVDWDEAGTRYSMQRWMIDELQAERQWQLSSVQRAALPVAFEGRDLLAMAPTGSGKTLAYLIPLLQRVLQAKAQSTSSKAESVPGPRALILSPTRELATQIYDETRRLLQSTPEARSLKLQDLKATAQNSGHSKKKTRKGLERKNETGGIRLALLTGGEKIRPIEGDRSGASAVGGRGAKFDIVIATPLRLVKAIEEEGWNLANVSQVVLDEADTLLSDAFVTQTDTLLAQCTATKLQKSLFSATLPSSVEALSRSFLAPDYTRLIVGSKDASSEDVDQELRFVGSEEGKLLELRTMLKTGQVKPPALLFVQSIERAKDLYSELAYDGLRLEAIHSELTRTRREQVIASFKRGDIWLLICTEVLSRGLDFKGVELVVNYDLPQSAESYVHRVGRTGRAGRKGRAVTFFTKDDGPHLPTIVNLVKQSSPKAVENIPSYLLEMPKMSKKQRQKLRKKAPQRELVSAASGSRSLEKDKEERRLGRRITTGKKDSAQSADRGRNRRKTRDSQAASEGSGQSDSDDEDSE